MNGSVPEFAPLTRLRRWLGTYTATFAAPLPISIPVGGRVGKPYFWGESSIFHAMQRKTVWGYPLHGLWFFLNTF